MLNGTYLTDVLFYQRCVLYDGMSNVELKFFVMRSMFFMATPT